MTFPPNALPRTGFIAILAVICTSVACDYGFRYDPKEEKVLSPTASPSRALRTTARPTVKGTVGTDFASQELAIHNGDRSVAVLEKATMTAGDGEYVGQIPSEEKARTIEPGQTIDLSIIWRFPRSAVDALGREPVLLLDFRFEDGASARMRVTYERSR